ncbi:MAG TPA: putative peptidoglycan glycosyltransferase FtsW [Promineifilum sp.]|nr:putative peptidoglycan glycosyltransferase FtsW [Promineifilum sp.]
MATINVIKKKGHPLWAGRNKYAVDYWLVLTAGALLVFGLLMVYSTTFDPGFLYKGDSTYYLTRQLGAMGIGLVAIIVLMQFDYHVLRYVSVPVLLGTCVILAVMLIVGKPDEYGAVRTLSAGSYQPSELAKLATILYIAHWLDSKGERIKNINYGLVPFSMIIGVMFALIVRQPALSTAILIVMINFTLFFVAGADLKQAAVVGGLALIVSVIMMLTLSHASQRIDSFMATLRDPQQASYQVLQSFAALANGGWFGVGLGQGNQKFGPLPLAHTDSVFATVGEELGLLGTVSVVVLFGILAWRGFLVASRARDTYGFLLAVGVTVWIAYQALINVAVITAVMPFTGMPMPFLSYGGSSMVMVLIGIGVLLNVSRDAALGRHASRRQPGAN